MALSQAQVEVINGAIRLAGELLSLRQKIEYYRAKHGQELWAAITDENSTIDTDLQNFPHLTHLLGGELTNFDAAMASLLTWGGDPNNQASNWHTLLKLVAGVPA